MEGDGRNLDVGVEVWVKVKVKRGIYDCRLDVCVCGCLKKGGNLG